MQSKKKKEPFRQRGGIWYFRVKVPGKFGEWKWTERKGGKTKTECRENYRRLMQELEAAELAAHLQGVGAKATACGSIEEGVRTARSLAGQDGVVLCFGSLYTIGSIKEALDAL